MKYLILILLCGTAMAQTANNPVTKPSDTRICTGSCMTVVGEDNDVKLANHNPYARISALEERVLALEKKDSVSREYSASLARQVQQLMSANADLEKRVKYMQSDIDHLVVRDAIRGSK